MQKGVLEILQNSQENTCARVKRLWHRCFPVNFAKFVRTPFSQNTYGRLLLPVFLLDPFENTSQTSEVATEAVLSKRCSQKICKFHRKSFTGTVLKTLFNRVADLQACNFIKKTLQYRCFLVKFTQFLRTPNLKSANDCF